MVLYFPGQNSWVIIIEMKSYCSKQVHVCGLYTHSICMQITFVSLVHCPFYMQLISCLLDNLYSSNRKTGKTYQLDVMSVNITAFGIHIPKQDMVEMT